MTDIPLPNNEVLSAFHDGEATVAECALVEQQLVDSAVARKELAAMRQVSSLLKQLPRENLPAEFPQEVLQAIEREMLIPSSRYEESSPSAARAQQFKSTSSRHWLGAAAVLTSAAGLLLLVRAVDDGAKRVSLTGAPITKPVSAPEETAPLVALNESRSGRALFETARPMASNTPLSRNAAVNGAAGSNSLVADAPAEASVRQRNAATQNLFFDQSTLRTAEIGDVVRAISKTEGDEVAVVWLTVVDRQEGLAGLQFLLANNHIGRPDSSAKSASPALRSSGDQMHAVLVESDAEQLAATLKQLREKTFVQSLEVDQPILLAQLDQALNEPASQADKTVEQRFAKRSMVAKPESAKELSQSASAKDRAAKFKAEASEKKIAQQDSDSAPTAASDIRAKQGLDSKENLAKQTTLELSADALVQTQSESQTLRRSLAAGIARSEPSQKQAEKAPTDHRPVQVLFVVVDQSQSVKQSAPSPPKAAPKKDRTKPSKSTNQDGAA